MAASTKRSSLPNPIQTQIKPSETQTTKPQERLCDFCGVSKALLYCRADSAKLCFTCDKDVHSTNSLFTKHTRSQLCDSCDSKPASIHCFTENLVLCQNCDWDSHGGGGHDRRPIEGFTGCPSATELCEILGFKDLGKEELGKKEGFFSGFEDDGMDLNVSGDWLSDLLVWETPSINSLDDLVFESDSRQDFHAMGVPSLPKNRDTACGKYKQTILGQLRDMLKSENSLTTYHKELGSPLVFEPLQLDQNLQSGFSGIECESDAVPIMFPNNEVRGCKWECNSDYLVSSPFSRSCAEESSSVLDKTNDVCSSEQDVNGDHDKQLQHHTMGETPAFLSKHAPQELIHHNRDASLLRYKEKKKTRRYDKQIRYETRKARAESRIRIKGRFAKVVNR